MFVRVLSEVDSESDSEKEVEDSTVLSRELKNVFDPPVVPMLEIPFSTQRVISRIDQAQLCRAKKDINMQLNDILSNVQRIINRYTFDQNLLQGGKTSSVEHNKKRRSNFMEKVSTFSHTLELREKTLTQVLAWLEEWNVILSEITATDVEERSHWIVQMEILPATFRAIESNIQLLTKISMSLLEDKKKQKKKITSRGTLWKPWKERVTKRPATAHALRPDQMISDEFATNTKVSEIQDMLQELIGSSMFSKMENNAIKYISSTITNLSKALSAVNEELKISLQSADMLIDETTEKGKELSLNIIEDLSEKNEMLQRQLQNAEEKCEQLIRSKSLLEHQFQVFAASPLKVFPKLSPQSSVSIARDGDIEDSVDSILAKEFANVVDETQRKGTRGLGVKWDPAISYTVQGQVTSDLTEQQHTLPDKKQKISPEDNADIHPKGKTDQYQSQKRKQTEKAHMGETSGSKVSDEKSEQKVARSKPSHHSESQTLGKKGKEIKSSSEAESKSTTESKSQHIPTDFPSTETQRQSDKSVASGMLEQLKVKSEYPSDRRHISSETKVEPTIETKDKEGKSEMSSLAEPLRYNQFEKMKGKKQHISPETTMSTEEKTDKTGMLAKPLELIKSHSGIAKETSESTRALVTPVGKSEQSNLEEFQKAIMTFLREKIDNVGKPFDKKTMLMEELLLKRAEAKKLGIIKAKLEEYFQKVAEIITKTLRKYKDIKKAGHVGEKCKRSKKVVSFMPELQIQKPSTSTKADISTFLSQENMDPVISNLIQMILTEIESERDVPVVSTLGRDHKEKEEQRRGKYLQGSQKFSGMSLTHQLLEEKNLWKDSHVMINKNLEKEKTWLLMKEGKQLPQMQKPWQEKEVWKEQQKQWIQEWTEEEEKQKQREKEEEQQRLLEAREPKTKEKGALLKEEEQMRQVQEEVRLLELTTRWEKAEDKQKVEDYERQRQEKATDQVMIKEKKAEDLEKMVSQNTALSSDSLYSPRQRSMLKESSQLYPRKEIHGNLKSFKVLPDGEHPIPITPPTSMQSSPTGVFPIPGDSPTRWITLTSEQAQALAKTLTPKQVQTEGIILTPEQAQALGLTFAPEQAHTERITLTPRQAQAQEITLTPRQAQTVGLTLTPDKAQALGITLTPQQVEAQGITLTPQQAQALGIILTPEEAQAQGITLTPQQAQALGITLTPQQAHAQGITLTSQQAQAQGINLTPQQAQALGIILTPEEAQAQGITLTPQQAQALGITLTPQQAQAQGITLTPQQAQALGITLTPQQAQAPGITLTPQQAQALGIILTPEEAQAQGITLTPQQAQALGIILTPEEAQAQGITLTPQQAQALGITLTPQQAHAQGITLTSQQAQAQGINLTPQQAQAQGITLTPQQAQALGIILTPEEAQAQGITLTPQQAQALGITLTPQQAHAQGITLTSQQAQAQGITLTSQQAQAQGINLTPQQAQALGIILTPEEAQAQGITLTPQQAQALGITLTPQQAHAQGITLTSQQAQAQGITLTSQQAQAQGITLTSQQAQAQGITLTPQQAQALGIILTPEEAQAQGITLTPQQAQALGIILTPEEAQAQGITLTPQQAQALGITLTPQQAHAQGITLTSQQAQAQGINLTPQQAQAQGITLTPQQAQALGIILTPEEAQAQGITLTPQQAQALGITLTPQQAQAQGITLTSQQAQAQGITLTPQQAQAQGITLTLQQARALGITLTPEKVCALGPPLTPKQAQSLGVSLGSKQAQALEVPLTEEQAKKSGVPITLENVQEIPKTLILKHIHALGDTPSPEQAQARGVSLAPGTAITVRQAQELGVPITPGNAWVSAVTPTLKQAQTLGPAFSLEQAQALGVSLIPEQFRELGVSLTSDKAHALGSSLTPEEAQPLGVPITPGQVQLVDLTLMPQQDLKSRAPFTVEQPSQLWTGPPSRHTPEVEIFSVTDQSFTPSSPHIPKHSPTLAPSTLRLFEELKASLSPGQSFKSSPSQFLPSSAISETLSVFGVSSPLQISRSPLTQSPYACGTSLVTGIASDPEKLLAPQTPPSSEGQPTPMQFLPPEIPPTRRQVVTSRGPLTPQPPLTLKPSLTPRQPLIPRVPPTSGQIPSLPPGQPWVSGASSIPGELLASRPFTLPEQPQVLQPPLWGPSTLGQQLAPWILPIPGQPSPFWVHPTPGQPPKLWAPPTPGKLQKDLTSFVFEKNKKGLEITSSLKSKSAFVPPSPPKFKAQQAPFTTKKFQMSEVSDTSEETQMLQDPFAMEQFRTLQSYLTDNTRTPVSQTPYIDEGAPPTLMKPIASLPSLITQSSKTSQVPLSEWDQKSRFPPIDKPWILTSVLATKKRKMIVPPSSPQELEEEEKYFVDVEAQRKNLVLLNQAAKTSGLSSQLHTTARNLIIETLHTDTVRLGYLFRKYIAYRLIQRARNNIIKQLQAIQNTGKGYESRNLYIMLSRIDDYQKKVMQVWTEKQKSLEQKRNQCLRNIMYLFSQLQDMYKLNLSQPIPLIIDEKPMPASTKFIRHPYLELLTKENRKPDAFRKFRQQKDHMEAIWNADLSTSSYPITEKKSIHSLWAQLGGYPDIPRLLQLDVHSTFRKSLASIQSQ
ncbi:protein FAM186A [Dugong dugon]